jgi:ferric-dicitrate binding protein FerR (iron transport regulator)
MSDAELQGNERARHLMMGALDGELSESERVEFDRLLERDPALQAEWARLRRLKEVTTSMTLRKPPSEIWDAYWSGVYQRVERGLAWILVSIGAIVLLSYGAWEGVASLIGDEDLPLFAKLATLAVIVGGVILLISVIREKLFVRRHDPYKDVVR